MCENRIRKAVGAIIFKDDEYLLVYKSKVMDGINGVENIDGIWDFPKGGVNQSDINLEKSILRELKEETGSEAYKIINTYSEKICFAFPTGSKYDTQETTMFYVEYLGDTMDLKPQDEEIDKVGFFKKNEVMKVLLLEETREFLKKVIW